MWANSHSYPNLYLLLWWWYDDDVGYGYDDDNYDDV